MEAGTGIPLRRGPGWGHPTKPRIAPRICVHAMAWILLTAGMSVLVFPYAAHWWSREQQTMVIAEYSTLTSEAASSKLLESTQANQAGHTEQAINMLRVSGTDVIGRISVPAVGIDLPIYPTSAASDLARGAGLLEGASAPVGGVGTHATITAHTGMATADMFDRLVDVKLGDRVVVTVLGHELWYEVQERAVDTPKNASSRLGVRGGEDLLTLVTCTPYGVNSHRLLVTGKRIRSTEPSPQSSEITVDQDERFPQWALAYVLGVTGVSAWVTWRIKRVVSP